MRGRDILAGCVIIASINHQLAPSPLSFLRLNSASCTTSGQKAIFQTASFDKFIWELSHLTHFLANISKAGKDDMTVVRLKRRLWNGWTTACCWICLDCAYISIQPTRERRSNCQTSTGKSHQTRAPLPASDISSEWTFMTLALSGSKLKERRCKTRHAVMIFALAGSNGPPLWHDPVWLQNHRFAKMCKLLLQKWQTLGVLIFYASWLQPSSFFAWKCRGELSWYPLYTVPRKCQ